MNQSLTLPVIGSPAKSNLDIVKRLTSARIIYLIGGHIVLAILMKKFGAIATIHAYFVFVFGIKITLLSKKINIEKVVLLCGYVVSSELLWRMNRVRLPWEFGKYFLILLAGVVLIRSAKIKLSPPIIYFILLVPSISLTINELGLNETARQAISFNLSGPLALTLSVLLLSQLRFSRQDLHKLLWVMLLPVISILTLAAFSTITTSNISFSTESNFVTSGGYGPNQVSILLGLGIILCIMLLIVEVNRRIRKIVFIVLIGLIVQDALTLSRGGLLAATLSILIFAVHSITSTRLRDTLLVTTIFLTICGFFIFPYLESFTDSMLSARWKETFGYSKKGIMIQTSGRDVISKSDLEFFRENTLMGVGPGMGAYKRLSISDTYKAAHNEFSRLPAEHGMLGVFALLILIVYCLNTYLKASTLPEKGWIATMSIWSFLNMGHSAMRIAVICFVFGMAFIVWEKDK